jgi:hypothetical protein
LIELTRAEEMGEKEGEPNLDEHLVKMWKKYGQ